MKVSDFGVKEVWNLKTILLAFVGVRTVQAVSNIHSFEIAIVGVPPWRALCAKDFFEKKCYELS